MFASREITRRLMTHGAALLMAVAGLSQAALAAPTISVGKIGVGGTGCPAGSASGRISSDGSQLTIRFTKFQVAAGGATRVDRKACALALPVSVPAGYAVAFVGLDYRGSTSLPSGASATLSVETFAAGGQGPKATRKINGPAKGRFAYSTTGTATVWSQCGASINLRVNTSLRVTTTGASAKASIRSQDVEGALIYKLKLKRC